MDPQQRAVAEEFNRFDREYDAAVNEAIAFSGLTVDAFTRLKARDLLKLIAQRTVDMCNARVLDVGCGIGNYHGIIAPAVGHLSGIDVSAACIEVARVRHPSVTYDCYDGRQLPYQDGAFDLAYAICVLHHVPVSAWNGFASELLRVVRPGGTVALYEHNPNHFLTRKVVTDCPFDRDAVLVPQARMAEIFAAAGGRGAELTAIATVPPLSGRLRSLTDGLDTLLAPLGWGTQYRYTCKKAA